MYQLRRNFVTNHTCFKYGISIQKALCLGKIILIKKEIQRINSYKNRSNQASFGVEKCGTYRYHVPRQTLSKTTCKSTQNSSCFYLKLDGMDGIKGDDEYKNWLWHKFRFFFQGKVIPYFGGDVMRIFSKIRHFFDSAFVIKFLINLMCYCCRSRRTFGF